MKMTFHYVKHALQNVIIFPVYYEVPKTPTDMVINSVGLLSKNLFKVQDTIAETAELLSPRSVH